MSAYSGIYTDMQGLAELRTQSQQQPATALEAVAGQFEALFTQMMLKTMRESSLNSDLFGSTQTSQYTEMFDNQVAIEMSRGRGLGLKQMLLRQLGGSAGAAAVPPVSGQSGTGPVKWQPADEHEFIAGLLPFAHQVERVLGVSHKAVIAQAALESGWGRHTLERPDGGDAFNVFGIKADSAWQGASVKTNTLEFHDGVGRRERASFRAYDSLGQAVNDYADFIRSNPRYQKALEHGADPHAYIRELQRAGYATDPDYAVKVGAILDGAAMRDSTQAGTGSLSSNRSGALR